MVYDFIDSCLTSMRTCQVWGAGEGEKSTRGLWTITSLFLKSFCNASAWLISFPQCTEDWLKQKLTASMIQGDFLLQSGPAMCGECLMRWEVGGGRSVCVGGCLPVGRGSERRILITATRTSSLGNTIWHCHTDACNPVGWSLPLNARFVQFGAAILGFPDVTYCLFVCLRLSAFLLWWPV